MKKYLAVIENNEDAFFAYVKGLDGCVAGAHSYEELKQNLIENIFEFQNGKISKEDFDIEFEIDLSGLFDLLPEINITQFAKLIKMNPGLLRQYASGVKHASENQAFKIKHALNQLSKKLQSIQIR